MKRTLGWTHVVAFVPGIIAGIAAAQIKFVPKQTSTVCVVRLFGEKDRIYHREDCTELLRPLLIGGRLGMDPIVKMPLREAVDQKYKPPEVHPESWYRKLIGIAPQ